MRGLKLTVYFRERRRAGGTLAAHALGELFARHGLRLAVLLRGIEGFGLEHRLQTHRVLTLSEDLPLVWVAIDEPERIEAVAREVERLLPQGLLTLERAQFGERAADLVPDEAEATKLTVYCGRRERASGRLAHHALVDRLRELGLEGASVLLGLDGVRLGERRRARFFHSNAQVPAMILAVGSKERVGAALPVLDGMLRRPLLTLERVRLLKRDGLPLAPPRRPPDEDPSGLGLWHKITVYTGEDSPSPDGYGPLYVELVRALREAGASGATVLGGVWGYSGAGAPHGDRFLALRRRVPVVCISVERPHRMAALWPIVDRITAGSGLVTGELVPAVRATGPAGRLGGLRLAQIE